MPQSQPNGPAAEFRIHGITATVWANQAQQGDRLVTRHSVQIQKRYFDKNANEWKTSGTYFPDDLPQIILAMQKAYEYIMLQAADNNANAA
jgi:hypothetical protein